YAVAAALAEESRILLLPTLGETPVLRFAPPLVIAEEELDTAIEGVERVCARLARNASLTITRALGALEAAPPVSRAETFLPPRPRRRGPRAGDHHRQRAHRGDGRRRRPPGAG